MFKSIEYKLYIGMALLLASVAAAIYFAISGEYLYFGLSILVTLWMLVLLRWHFSKFNKNIVFLLNALENGDFSFRFGRQGCRQGRGNSIVCSTGLRKS